MCKLKILCRLILADILRLKKYLFSVIVSTLLLLCVCSAAGTVISENIYKDGTIKTISIGYYYPEDDGAHYNQFAIGMLENMQSIKESARLERIYNIDKGYEMVENGELTYLIILPGNFYLGVMTGDNPQINIVLKDKTSIVSYISNELFLSLSTYLGIAQSAVYASYDILKENGVPDDQIDAIQNVTNLVFLDRALNKESYVENIESTNEESYTLKEFYIATAVMVSLIFVAIAIMPHMMGHGKGILTLLDTRKINTFHIYISNTVSAFLAVYLAYIICFTGISIYSKGVHPSGLYTAIPYLIVIALIISFAALLGKNNIFTGNMIILFTALILAYLGGGIIPQAMLPSVIKNLPDFISGRSLIKGIAAAIFG